jgi:SAM-dependent methyltransferase
MRLALTGLTTKRPNPLPAVDPIADYYELAVSLDWGALIEGKRADRLNVLDVGSGTGRFLRVLNQVWPELQENRDHVGYSAVDPVPGVAVAAMREASRFATPDGSYEVLFQDLELSPNIRFDVIWALHSLYSLHPTEVDAVVGKIAGLLAPGGVAIIALSDLTSFYAKAKPHYTGEGRYALADDVVAAVQRHTFSHEILTLRYDEVIPAGDEAALKNYLWNESIGNTWVPEGGSAESDLPNLPEDSWWESFRHVDSFVFPQTVPVVQFWVD